MKEKSNLKQEFKTLDNLPRPDTKEIFL